MFIFFLILESCYRCAAGTIVCARPLAIIARDAVAHALLASSCRPKETSASQAAAPSAVSPKSPPPACTNYSTAPRTARTRRAQTAQR